MPDKPVPKTERPTKRQIPPQRWQIFPAQKAQAQQISQATALSPLLSQVLINRGVYTPEQAWEFLDPETLLLPSPLDEFPDLHKTLDLLVEAIAAQRKILICGDYDADGMTSTALLMRSLRYLKGQVDYAIPSRMDEGYGINTRIVEEFHASGGSIILTVDNGIAAYDPVARARELGLTVILTDHHEVPQRIPPANAILNPKLIREDSPYRGVAGVGVAYILAVCLAQRLDKMQDLTATLLALFTLGTIADLAPLTGVNRRWVKRGLKLLPKSQIPGVQALIEVAGLSEDSALKPEAIGFRLGPRINAVGRIADPQIVIDLLTTDDIGVALQRAMQCEEANKLRRQMCEVIEAQAVDWVEDQQAQGLLELSQERVLVVVQPEWHHGVIGIVASRLVERYGVPVFIGTYEDKAQKEIRGSARSIPEFNVFEALQFCDDLLDRYGGHRAAGGFSFDVNKLRQVKARLKNFACKHLQPEHLKPLVTADVEAELADANLELYSQIDRIHPCGIENPDPVFWTANATVVEQKVIGKTNSHLKLTLKHLAEGEAEPVVMKAIAWRWGQYYPLPRDLDIAYKLRLNEWRGQSNVELELVGVRAAQVNEQPDDGIRPWSANAVDTLDIAKIAKEKTADLAQKTATETISTPAKVAKEIALNLQKELENKASLDESSSLQAKSSLKRSPTDRADVATPIPPYLIEEDSLRVEFYHSSRRYKGMLERESGEQRLSIQNNEGHLLLVQMSDRQGFLYLPEQPPTPVDITNAKYFNLIRAGLSALEVKQKTQLLIKKDELLEEKDAQIVMMKAQIELLEEKIAQLSVEKQQAFATLKTELAAQEDTIQGKEAHIEQMQVQTKAVSDDVALKAAVRADVGDGVWSCLQPDSQKDLQAAYNHYRTSHTSGPDAHIVDYSEAGDRLSSVIVREALTPFIKDLSVFLRGRGITTIGGIPLIDHQPYSLDMLPPLLADQWRSFSSEQLAKQFSSSDATPTLANSSVSVVKVKANGQVSEADRALLTQFFDQWEHSMSKCFSRKGRQAASSLDQISKLRSLATHSQSALYQWQYELMHQLVTGKAGKGGLLKQIFAL